MVCKFCAGVRGAVYPFNSCYLDAVYFALETRNGLANGRCKNLIGYIVKVGRIKNKSGLLI